MADTQLDWEYEGDGRWQALSWFHDEGCSFEWVISVTEEGTFDVSESDDVLTTREPRFETLRQAQYFCQRRENELAEGIA